MQHSENITLEFFIAVSDAPFNKATLHLLAFLLTPEYLWVGRCITFGYILRSV